MTKAASRAITATALIALSVEADVGQQHAPRAKEVVRPVVMAWNRLR